VAAFDEQERRLPTGGQPIPVSLTRRRVAGGLMTIALIPLWAREVSAEAWNDVARRIEKLVGSASITQERVHLTMPSLAENGNLVALTVSVDSPMTEADHVSAIYIFSERNPQATLAVFHLSPKAGRAQLKINVRLATTQRVIAIARTSDGRFWSGATRVVVTDAACVDGG
jgi:sulfur-oxidizing protein SoxY